MNLKPLLMLALTVSTSNCIFSPVPPPALADDGLAFPAFADPTNPWNFFRHFTALPTAGESLLRHGEKSQFQPGIKLAQEGNDLLITCEVPGVEARDMDLTITNKTLHLKGKRSQDGSKSKGEAATINFEEYLTLPTAVDSNGATASLRNGILKIRAPRLKDEGNAGRKLTIKEAVETPG